MNTSELTNFKHQGARIAIQLHEETLRQFVDTWKTSKNSGAPLPQTKDPNYASYETLLRHVLWWAREYMVWICDKLELPNPQINQTPDPENIESEVDQYVEHLIQQWRKPLVEVSKTRFLDYTYKSNWLAHYCIDAMLEHAVMHVIRHRRQLLLLQDTR